MMQAQAKNEQDDFQLEAGSSHGVDAPVSYTHLDVYKRQSENSVFGISKRKGQH